MYTVIVSIKSFLKFLNAHSVSTTTIACKIAISSTSRVANCIIRRLSTPLSHPLCLHRRCGGCRRGLDLLCSCCHRRVDWRSPMHESVQLPSNSGTASPMVVCFRVLLWAALLTTPHRTGMSASLCSTKKKALGATSRDTTTTAARG